MVLKLEDGTGGDSLITLDYFKAYCEAHGYDISDADDVSDLEPACRRASTYISNGWVWQGYKIGQRTQLQAWPRYDVQDAEGFPVDNTSIPHEVSDATCEATFYEYENPNGLTPVSVLSGRVQSETVGPISVTYTSLGPDASYDRPVLPILMDILKALMGVNATASAFTGRANRG